MHPDSDRLFALDEALRAEGQAVLEASGLGALIDEYGFLPVGSQAMHTMTWRDLDFERIQDPPDWEEHSIAGPAAGCQIRSCSLSHSPSWSLSSPQ